MSHLILPEREMGVHEECGIIGIMSKTKTDLARDIYYGLFALQHRGQESAGIAVAYNEKKVAYYKNMGLVHEVFSDEELSLLPETNFGIGHVRYSTTGTSNVVNAQPVVFYGRHGRMAVAHNGNIINVADIKQRMIANGHIFQSSTDSEVVAALINESGGVLPETQEKVREAVERLHYEPNLSARNLRKNESRIILILAPNFSNPYYSNVL
ncbi:MAG TPA: LacI family DNA-binding transcriptional regulator, partial [Eubacteriales bacterium]|nr:LacI family DNA-binding transcriptional regulator [Eubacteriales bacterium]